MTKQTNEMDAYGTGMPAAGMDVSLNMDPNGEYGEPETITISEPGPKEMDPESVYVHANSINPVSSMSKDNNVAFDVVFSVSCTCPDTGAAQTFQVVKRIAVDKMKMAHEAKSTSNVSVVESKPAEKFAMSESVQRWKTIAGIK